MADPKVFPLSMRARHGMSDRRAGSRGVGGRSVRSERWEMNSGRPPESTSSSGGSSSFPKPW